MQRRSFLKTAALSTLGVAALPSLTRAQDKKRIPIAVQVYSVRSVAKDDLAGTLKAIAKMGYDGVEFAGYYGQDPKDIRKMLDDCGLKCSGTHTGLGAYGDDNFNKTVDIHKTLGTRFMIVPGNPREYAESLEANKKIADRYNAIAEKCKAVDMVVGYHAHGFDAKLIDGISAWERLFDATDASVLHQMDFGNFMQGGGDPYKMVEKFKGRSKSVHLKETGKDIIGSGKVDWKRAFELCETVGGTEWYVVEDEHASGSAALERIELCLKALKDMGK